MINHIGFIMDGNRRFSKKNLFSLDSGYKAGLEQFLKFVQYQIDFQIKETSYFALSNDNLNKRPESELKILRKLLETLTQNEKIKTLFLKNKIKITIVGKEPSKSENKKFKINELKEELNKWNNKNKIHDYFVNIAINYDGQLELSEAMKKIANKITDNELNIEDITEQTIKENIWFNNSKPPEIIVRSGDAPRLSGFMLWDSQYSEIYLTKKLWPELTKQDYQEIINWFSNQKRNFGK